MEKEEILIQAVPWSEEAAAFLEPTCISASVEDYREMVEAGAVLFRVSTSRCSRLLGFYILRVDNLAQKNIGVLVTAAGLPGYDFAGAVMPFIEQQFIGVDEIQQYCSRAGMVRKLLKQGWEPTHLVMKKRVSHG